MISIVIMWIVLPVDLDDESMEIEKHQCLKTFYTTLWVATGAGFFQGEIMSEYGRFIRLHDVDYKGMILVNIESITAIIENNLFAKKYTRIYVSDETYFEVEESFEKVVEMLNGAQI